MQTKTTAADLQNRITQLEIRQSGEWILLKEAVSNTAESLQPLNLIKNSFKKMVTSEVVKDNIVDTSIGLTAGYLSKLLIVGATQNPIRRLFGAFLQLGITNLITKNANAVKPLVGSVVKAFSKK